MSDDIPPGLIIRAFYRGHSGRIRLRGHWFIEKPTALDYGLNEDGAWHQVSELAVFSHGPWEGFGPILEPGVFSLTVRDRNRPDVTSNPITIGAEPLDSE